MTKYGAPFKMKGHSLPGPFQKKSPAKHPKAKEHKHPGRQLIEKIKSKVTGKKELVWVGNKPADRPLTTSEQRVADFRKQYLAEKEKEKQQKEQEKKRAKTLKKQAKKKKRKGWAVKVGGLTAGGGDLKKYEKILSKEELAEHKTRQSKTYKGL